MARSAVSGRQVIRDMVTCLSFDGVGDYVDLGNAASLVPAQYITLEAWINCAAGDTGGNDMKIISKDDAGSNRCWQFRLQGSTRKLEFIPFNSGSNADVVGNTALNDGKWHHVVATWDGTTIYLYVDGVQNGTGSLSGTLRQGLSNHAYIGTDLGTSPTGDFKGKIDEPCIYNRALTVTEVTNRFNGVDITNGLIAKYKFDEQSGSSVTESSGTQANGTIVNATYSWDAPVKPRQVIRDMGTCLLFNGSNTKVTESATSAVTTSTSITIACWFRTTKDPVNNALSQVFVMTKYVYLHIRLTSTSQAVTVRFDEASGHSANSTNISLGDRSWHHAAGVFEYTSGTSGNLYAYVDGVLRATATFSALPSLSYTEGLGTRDSSTFYGGYLDDVRVYTRVLSATEVSNLYYGHEPSTSNLVLWYKLDEGSGSSATDSSGNSNTGTISNGTYSTNVFMKPRTSVSGRVAA